MIFVSTVKMTKKADTLHRSNLCNYCKQVLFTRAALNGLIKVLKKLFFLNIVIIIITNSSGFFQCGHMKNKTIGLTWDTCFNANGTK